MGKAGFSWKTLFGVTKAKRSISRKTGIPLTKSGRQRKIGKIVSGGKGCLITILLLLILLSVTSLSVIRAFSGDVENNKEKNSNSTYLIEGRK